MAFVTKEWKDRLVEFAGRRLLKNVSTNEETVYDVSRNEGAVSQDGDAFSAANMNDLEQRIKDGFDDVNSNLIDIYVGDDGKLHKVQDGADSVLPFKRAQTSFSGSSQFYYRSSDKVNHTWLSINFDATSYKKVTITSTYPYQIYMDGTSAGWKTASGTYDISDANTLGVTIRTGNATANDSQIYSGNWSVDFK